MEVLAEHLIKTSQVSQEDGVGAAPFVIVELVGQEFHFDESLALGVEVTAGISTEVLDLIVKALGQIGGAQLRVEGRGVFEKSQVVGGALFQVFDPSAVIGPELFQ